MGEPLDVEGWLRRAGRPERGVDGRYLSLPVPTILFPGDGESTAGAIEVKIEPHSWQAGAAEMAEAIARTILDAIPSALGLRAAARRAREAQAAAEGRLSRLTQPRHVLGGALAVRPDEARGGVWLTSRAPRRDAFGFWFKDMASLWREHPDLRPVWWGSDELGSVLHVESQPWTAEVQDG